MDLYLSGAFFVGNEKYNKLIAANIPNSLLTLAYPKQARAYLDFLRYNKEDHKEMKIMFDSGAFTAWNNGDPAPKVENLLKMYKGAIKVCGTDFKEVWFISLDQIPGVPGRMPTKEEIDEALRVSDENHRILKSELGNQVLPVFHQSEDIERLQRVVELNPEYICISPRNDAVEVYRRTWAQRVHQLVPGVRTHGLGATAGRTLTEVPWASVDSASWIMSGAYGNVMLPIKSTLRSVAVSQHSPNRRKWGKHIDTETEEIRAALQFYCDKLGLEIEELRIDRGARSAFSAYTFSEFVNNKVEKTIPVAQTLFAL